MAKQKMTTENFIQRAIEKHGKLYDYEKSIYKHYSQKIIIICSRHGEFQQIPQAHLRGQGCAACVHDAKRWTTEDFITESTKIHNGKYKYDKTNYIGCFDPVVINCPIHGDFEQQAHNHSTGRGCPSCGLDSTKYTNKEFIDSANLIHNNKYTYNNCEYIGSITKVKITCNIHGDFLQEPRLHLSKKGCPDCGGNTRYTNEKYIQKAKTIHGDKYIYDEINYINGETKIIVICKEHGRFAVAPKQHLQKRGCRKCHMSKNELAIDIFLTKMNLDYKHHYNLDGCVYKNKLYFDFVVFINNTVYCIEFNGSQHYYTSKNKTKEFEQQKLRDKKKKEFCRDNKIPLLIIKYDQEKEYESLIRDFLNITTNTGDEL